MRWSISKPTATSPRFWGRAHKGLVYWSVPVDVPLVRIEIDRSGNQFRWALIPLVLD